MIYDTLVKPPAKSPPNPNYDALRTGGHRAIVAENLWKDEVDVLCSTFSGICPPRISLLSESLYDKNAQMYSPKESLRNTKRPFGPLLAVCWWNQNKRHDGMGPGTFGQRRAWYQKTCAGAYVRFSPSLRSIWIHRWPIACVVADIWSMFKA